MPIYFILFLGCMQILKDCTSILFTLSQMLKKYKMGAIETIALLVVRMHYKWKLYPVANIMCADQVCIKVNI
jgi:hypothetical protein